MLGTKYTIQDPNQDVGGLARFLESSLDINHKTAFADGCVLFSEKFYFRINSTQLNVITIRKGQTGLLCVEVMAGGGGTGVFNINLGAERKFIKTIDKLLEAYCEERHLQSAV